MTPELIADFQERFQTLCGEFQEAGGCVCGFVHIPNEVLPTVFIYGSVEDNHKLARIILNEVTEDTPVIDLLSASIK